MCMCVCVSECAHVHRSLQGLEMGVRCPGLESGEVVRTLIWVLGTELQFSARAATAHNHWDIYPAPHSCVPIVTKTATFYHTDFIYNTMIEGEKAIFDAYSIRHGFQEIKIKNDFTWTAESTLYTPSPHHCLSHGSTVADSAALRTRVNRRPLIAGPPESSICLQVIISHTQWRLKNQIEPPQKLPGVGKL